MARPLVAGDKFPFPDVFAYPELERLIARSKESDLWRTVSGIADLRAKLPDLKDEFNFLREVHWFIQDEADRRRFESGDVLGLFDCVICCSKDDRAVPNWARDALAEKFQAYRDPKTSLQVALLGSPTRRGRLADPRKRSAQLVDNLFALAAVLAAERQGYRGEKKFDRAQALLREHPRRRHVVSPERLRQLKKDRSLYWQARIVELLEFSGDPVEALRTWLKAELMRQFTAKAP